jgi:tetratricopeptide (TPR) repeat protein
MKDEPRSQARHQFDHAVPTVIHNPEQDLNTLARWFKHALENPARFWGIVAVLVVLVVGGAFFSNGLSLGGAESDEAWTRLETAETPNKRVEIAEEYPNTQASRWALLQAASEFYRRGFFDLPNNRDVAGPTLKRALELFERVERDPAADAVQARTAAFGIARTLEAQNKLDKAIEQYHKVAKNWPGTDEAAQADSLARELAKPESETFYKELYAYTRPEFTLPPLGDMKLPINHPPMDGSLPSMLLPPLPPRGEPKKGEASTPAPTALPPLPDDVFAPPREKKPGEK